MRDHDPSCELCFVQSFDILTKRFFSVCKIDKVICRVCLRWHRDQQIRRGLEPYKEFGLVSAQSIRRIFHVVEKEWNGAGSEFHVWNEVLTPNLLHYGGSWLFKRFYVDLLFIPAADPIGHVEEI